MKIVLFFGGEPYEIPDLPARRSREWRHRLVESARELCDVLFKETNGHDDVFFAGLGAAYLTFPDKMLEMLLLYAPDLPQAKIKETASDEDIVYAFSEIMRRAFPYLKALSLMATFDVANRLSEASDVNLDRAAHGVNQSEPSEAEQAGGNVTDESVAQNAEAR
jgi:hypothetical protein